MWRWAWNNLIFIKPYKTDIGPACIKLKHWSLPANWRVQGKQQAWAQTVFQFIYHDKNNVPLGHSFLFDWREKHFLSLSYCCLCEVLWFWVVWCASKYERYSNLFPRGKSSRSWAERTFRNSHSTFSAHGTRTIVPCLCQWWSARGYDLLQHTNASSSAGVSICKQSH